MTPARHLLHFVAASFQRQLQDWANGRPERDALVAACLAQVTAHVTDMQARAHPTSDATKVRQYLQAYATIYALPAAQEWQPDAAVAHVLRSESSPHSLLDRFTLPEIASGWAAYLLRTWAQVALQELEAYLAGLSTPTWPRLQWPYSLTHLCQWVLQMAHCGHLHLPPGALDKARWVAEAFTLEQGPLKPESLRTYFKAERTRMPPHSPHYLAGRYPKAFAKPRDFCIPVSDKGYQAI
jgi:hypothetical protein